jgi:putative DNA primase/helicase
MESHLAKYRSLVPTLALLDHLAGTRCGPVGAGSVERAIRWAKYLESHARRVYGATVDDRFAPARELSKRITRGMVPTPFAARDVYRKGWTGLSDKLDVEAACDILADHNWLAVERKSTAGRTATNYRIHPALSAANNGDAPRDELT